MEEIMKEYKESELDVLNAFIDGYLDTVAEKYSHDDNILQKIAHIKRTAKLAEMITGGNEMAIVAAKFHDIGRIPQFEILGGFRDDLILHHNLGEDFITRLIFKKLLKPSQELDTIRQAAMYHGRMQFIPFIESPITQEAAEITTVISIVDDLDNGCLAALGYIEKEIVTDFKSYAANHPDLDMKSVTPRVYEFYSKGEKFNKLTECKTNADYLLFAAVLAIQSLKGEHKKLAAYLMSQPCFGYESALAGYKDLFTKFIDPALAMKAYEILENYYNLAKEETSKKTSHK